MINFTCESDLEIDSQGWLVEEVLPVGSISIIQGKNGYKNSQIATDLAFCVATGRNYNGNRVDSQSPVLYITVDSTNKFAKRAKCWKKTNNITSISQFSVCSDSINLVDKKDLEQLTKDISYSYRLAGNKEPELIVIDIQGTLMGNNTLQEYANKLRYSMDYLRREVGASILLVFNEGISENDSTYATLFNAADAVHDFEEFLDQEVCDTNSLPHLICKKMKDHKSLFGFSIDISCVGSTDEWWS